MSSASESFRVLYAKAGAKKRKLFSDGFLHIKEGSGNAFLVSLCSEDGDDLRKSSEKTISVFKTGKEVVFGSFVVQIEESICDGKASVAQPMPPSISACVKPSASNPIKNSNFRAPSSTFRAPAIVSNRPSLLNARPAAPASLPPVEEVCDHDSFWDSSTMHDEPQLDRMAGSSSSFVTAIKPGYVHAKTGCAALLTGGSLPAPSVPIKKVPLAKNVVEQDPSLTKLMRPHQIIGANFLISRLLNEPTGEGEGVSTSEGVVGGGGGDSSDDGDIQDIDFPADADCTGGILADEMGVGKTLTAISVVWAFVRKGGRKALIVCPSSLVDNWVKEIKHWLGTKVKPLTLKAGADCSAVINTFAISMATLYPVMVLSYEMFRKHAVLLNTVPSLELIVCDEGHRLKNIGGSKTMQALGACKAFRRVILSGTPIQNDLEELYAVVAFVAPGFLGSLSQYKSRIALPISRGNEADATALDREQAADASDLLRRLLSKIMLRRTQADILTTLLPPRSDYVVYCVPSPAQAAEYAAVAQDIQRSLGMGSARLDGLDSGPDLLLLPGDEEAIEDNCSGTAAAGSSSVILPGLQSLRRICNTASTSTTSSTSSSSFSSSGKMGSSGGFASARDMAVGQKENLGGGGNSYLAHSAGHSSSSAGSVRSMGTLGGKGRAPTSAQSSAGGKSTKLQVLACFIGNLRKLSPDEKIVVVSNFTTALDDIETLAKCRAWGDILRLDGKVPVDQRQSLVNRFNRSDDPSFLFLLSAKAGGVGINLIGASRLVMFDVDWNPAVDLQAMSRVWREGQRRPVHIYRLIMAGTIEDAILQRQRSKRDLANLMDGGGAEDETGAGAEEGLGAFGRKSGSEKRMSLTRKDVLQLLYPSSTTTTTSPQPSSKPLQPVLVPSRISASAPTVPGRVVAGGGSTVRRHGRVQCSDEESGADEGEEEEEEDNVEEGEDDLLLADVLPVPPSPNSCSTYAEEPVGPTASSAISTGGGDEDVGGEGAEKEISDEVLLVTINQLGSSVICKASFVE